MQKSGMLARLGRVNEFEYERKNDTRVKVKCYALFGREDVDYVVRKGSSKPINSNQQQQVGNNNNDTAESIVEMEEPNDDSYLAIVNPEENSYQSIITGVTVWARARLRRQMRRRIVSAEKSLELATNSLDEIQQLNYSDDEVKKDSLNGVVET